MQFSRTPMAAAISLALLTCGMAATFAAHAADDAPAPAAAPAAQGEQQAADGKADAKKDRKDQPKEVEQVVVTANKRSQAAYKVPYNVSAMTETMLREANITDVKKLIAQSPSINTPNNGARYNESVTVRGLSNSGVGSTEFDYLVRTSVAYYLDDTPLPNLNYRIKDIARVETLLGPQGTLYGASSLGGTIRYITNRPQLNRTELNVNLNTYFTEGAGGLSWDPDVVFNVPVGERFALRGSLSMLDEQGYIDRLTNAPWRTGAYALPARLAADDNDQRVKGGRVSALWKLSKDAELVFAHTRQHQKAAGSPSAQRLPAYIADGGSYPGTGTVDGRADTPYVLNDHTVVGFYQDRADRKLNLNSIDLDWDVGIAKLHSATSHYTDKKLTEADLSAFLGGLFGSDGSYAALYPQFAPYQHVTSNYKGLTHETRLVSSTPGPWSWIAGLYHTRQERRLGILEMIPGYYAYRGLDVGLQGGMRDREYQENMDSTYRETALFGEATYRVTDKWQVSAGLRTFRYSDKAESTLTDYLGDTEIYGAPPGTLNTTSRNADTSGRKTYFKFNTAYQLGEDRLVYGTVSQGFRRGGANPFKQTGDNRVNPAIFSYDPDTTTNVEIGLKGYFFGRDLYLETDIYRINWKNTQTGVSYSDKGLIFNGTINGADAHTQGWEFNARYRVTPNWQVMYSTAYTEGAYDEDLVVYRRINPNGRPVTFQKGATLSGSPKWKHNAGVKFTTQFDNGMSLRAGLNARYVGAVGRIPGQKDIVIDTFGAYTLVNGNIGVSMDNWDASLYVENLTNRRVVVSGTGAVGDAFGGVREHFNVPRTIGLQVSYSFF